MAKFKANDKIQAIAPGLGLEKAVVLGTYIEKKGKHKGREMYKLLIPNGLAYVPTSTEVNYKKVK